MLNINRTMRADWEKELLGNLFYTTSGGTPSRRNPENYQGNIPWVKSGELDKGIIKDSEEKISEDAIKRSSAKLFPIGTLLFAMYGATIGKLAFLGIEAATNQAICGIYRSSYFNPLLLFYFLKFKKNHLVSQGTGGAQPNISQTILKRLEVPIPPLPEQRAIVQKLEALFSDLDQGVADLKKAQEQLQVYRQAVLKKAFEGTLLKTGIRKNELPNGWKTKTIKEVCINIKVGVVIKPKKYYSEENTRIHAFRSANVREFYINDSNWVYFSEKGNETNKRTQLKAGDVLIVRSGYPGTSCVVPPKYEGSNAIDILIATPNEKLITPKFLCAFNNSPLAKGLFSEGARGVAQKHLNVGVYSNLTLSIPPLIEQHQIVNEIESRLSICDALEQTIAEGLQKAQALRQSLLKKAFEGTLLSPQELEACKAAPDWEPAHVLLEKIKKERNNG